MQIPLVAALVSLAVLLGFVLGRRRERRTVIWQSEPTVHPRTIRGTIDVSRDPELVAALQRGEVVTAIKRHRELTGMGLKESKDEIERVLKLMQ